MTADESMQRSDTPEGVRYADARARVAASILHDEWMFSLPKLDDWIEQRPAAERAALLRHRAMLLDAVLAGEARAVLPWVLFFAEVTRSDAREQAFAPRAAKQARRASKEAAMRDKAAAAVRKYTDDDKLRWRSLRAGVFSSHTKRRAAELIVQREGLPASAFEAVRRSL